MDCPAVAFASFGCWLRGFCWGCCCSGSWL